MLGGGKKIKDKTKRRQEINHKAEAQKFHFNKFIIHANLSNMGTLNHPERLSVMGDTEFLKAYSHFVNSGTIKCGCIYADLIT